MRWWNIRLGLGFALFPSLLLLIWQGPRGLIALPAMLGAQDTPILIRLAMTGGMNLLAVPMAWVLPEDLQAQFLPAVLNVLGGIWLLLIGVLVVVGNPIS